MGPEEVCAIPAKRAIILWEEDGVMVDGRERCRVSKVLVCRIDQQPVWSRNMLNSRGACDFDWLDGSRWDNCPIGQFLGMATTGFVNEEAKIAALKEFAKIGGQRWALDLYREETGQNLVDE
jgi:hypothetical protein